MTRSLEKTLGDIGYLGKKFIDYQDYYNVPWIYALFSDSCLVYIGISKNISSRIKSHKRNKKFNKIRCMQIDVTDAEMRRIEKILIQRHYPESNKLHRLIDDRPLKIKRPSTYFKTTLRLNTNLIRNKMKQDGVTVRELSHSLNRTPAAIYDILKRRPVSQADRFAEILELDARDLVVNE